MVRSVIICNRRSNRGATFESPETTPNSISIVLLYIAKPLYPFRNIRGLARMSTKRKGFDGDLAVHNGGSRIHHFPKRKSIRRGILAVVITAILFIAYIHNKGVTYNVEESILHYLSLTNEEQARLHDHQLASLAAGLKQCININQRPISESDEKRTNPRAVRSVSPQIIKNATLIDGDGSILAGKSILLSEGVIKQIDHDMDYPKEAKIIDAGGRYVSPGLVDMVPLILNTLTAAFSCRRQFTSRTFWNRRRK